MTIIKAAVAQYEQFIILVQLFLHNTQFIILHFVLQFLTILVL